MSTIYSRTPFSPGAQAQRVRTLDGVWIRVTRAGHLHAVGGGALGERVHPLIWSGFMGAVEHFEARHLGAVVAALNSMFERSEHPAECDFHHGIPAAFRSEVYRARGAMAKARREAREALAA